MKDSCGNIGKRSFFKGRREQVVNAHRLQTKEFVLYPTREVTYTKPYFFSKIDVAARY